ncbi:AraC family transcriptional regulator [Cohnella algarum]|uniref:AraC family transcriptional regulator n=2 Tax=Cohnella TaxID=329857 RepID=UPI00196799C8|nr:helix-turn-helix domain-containing protein [Cohnella algarum]MBN2983116.1 helix-turn-helix domain-containing protein [Cohnella algarum]
MSVMRPIDLLRGTWFYREELPIYVNRAIETFSMSEHRHDFVEISYVSEGAGTHHFSDTSFSVVQGDIVLIPVGQSHVFRPASASGRKPLIVYNCVFAETAAVRLLGSFPGSEPIARLFEHREIRRYRDRYGEFGRLFQRLHYEFASDRFGRESALYIGLLELLLFLCREDNEVSGSGAQGANGGMEAALHALHTQFAEPLSVAKLARLAGVGERQFHRVFRKQTGMSPVEYAQTVRINEACRLLKTSRRKIADIASAVGYQDTPFFNGLFKKITGVSPREYRRRD